MFHKLAIAGGGGQFDQCARGTVRQILLTLEEPLNEICRLSRLTRDFERTLLRLPHSVRITATIVASIKEGRVPEDWKDKLAKLAQKDRDARWTVK